tara:strand:- start:2242 stop:3105 length:864 start_codon:yes stop_codon:yes gene_type:complete
MTSVPYSTRKSQSVNSLTNTNIAPSPTDNDVLTYKSSTNSWINQSIAGGSAINAQTIDITDNNTDTTLYIVLTDNAGVTQSLNVDSITTPISVNPNTGDLNVVDTLKLDQLRVAVGKRAGAINQLGGATALGQLAGNDNQGKNAVAVGFQAGQTEQLGIAVGSNAGNANQALGALAIGVSAGNAGQGRSTVAIGINAATTSQGDGAIAIGSASGNLVQGTSSIAIGKDAASLNQPANQIFISASGTPVNGANTSACYINPIRGVAHGIGVGVMKYDPVLFEVTYSTT